MKRDPALHSLSHDHHRALVAAQRLTRATLETRADARAGLLSFWEEDGARHFRDEEEILLPAYARHCELTDPLFARALLDHTRIRADVEAVRDSREPPLGLLQALGKRLAEHVRMEERELFPLVEQALPAAELERVAERLDEADRTRPRLVR